jgi:2,3-diketo-5-methylthio-1-phosphopentane phosphatase
VNNRYNIFIDFDGTITANDVGYEMFKLFTRGATEPLVQAYRNRQINSLECLSQECNLWNQVAPSSRAVYAYLDSQPLSPGLDTFLEILRKNDLSPVILSEGFNFYVDRVLDRGHLGHLKRITNLASFHHGRLSPAFPYYGLGCQECSNCKGNHIKAIRPAESCALYIGDGHSDLHASKAADLIFAKSHLKSLLENDGRQFIEYQDFHDVAREFQDLLLREVFTQSARVDFCWFAPRHYQQLQALWESGDVMKFVGYPHGLGWSQDRHNHHWQELLADGRAIHLALENRTGVFIGEAQIAFPDIDGFCQHDVKLRPEFQHQGLGGEAWRVILERTESRWPHARPLVTPSVENTRAIDLYRRLGFAFDGDIMIWQPPPDAAGAVPVRYRRMVK